MLCVFRVTCPCCFVCVCVCFGDSFLCSISLLLSDSLSCVLNSVLINAIVHVTYCIWLVDLTANAVYIKRIKMCV